MEVNIKIRDAAAEVFGQKMAGPQIRLRMKRETLRRD
jgi:hypothetical protein